MAKKEIIVVPKGIRYISDWKDYDLRKFNFPHILDKKIPGCGFTEYCLTSNFNLILCSPRKMLLENKYNQHPDDVYYFQNVLESESSYDQDLTKAIVKKTTTKIDPSEIKKKLDESRDLLLDYINRRISELKPIKIIVTYDSFRLVKEFLISLNIFYSFYTVVDEQQSLFIDSKFKSDTELEFINHLFGISNLCFVSATPYIEEYLREVDIFKDIPYFELDWLSSDPDRVASPDFKPYALSSESINQRACKIIQSYKSGNFEYKDFWDSNGNLTRIYSTEAVFYINCVNNIIQIIEKTNLKPEECNILCSRTQENANKLKTKLGKEYKIGKIPLKGEPHKMFTFCTRTVYLGADFYSTCARTFIFSNANINSLAVDISLDLQQIVGRQRLESNPWKNSAEFYFNNSSLPKDYRSYNDYLEEKKKKTETLLEIYDKVYKESPAKASILLQNYEAMAEVFKYRENYVAVNHHGGANAVPVFNKLAMISEKRAFDIQRIDYKNQLTVFNTMAKIGLYNIDDRIKDFLTNFERLTTASQKIEMLCKNSLTQAELSYVLNSIPSSFKNYYEKLGPDKCRALGYNITKVQEEYSKECHTVLDLPKIVGDLFDVGKKYKLVDIKIALQGAYNKVNLKKTAKASDLLNWFEVKKIQVTNKITGKRDVGYELLSKKK